MPYGKTGKRLHKIDILRNGKLRLSFSGKELVVSKDTFTNHFLYEGKDVSAQEIFQLEKENSMDDLFRYGKRLALRGAYSSFEMKEKLFAKNPKNAAKVLLNLINEGFIDDKRLAHDIFETKLLRGYGEERIKRELLLEKHIDVGIVNSLDAKKLDKKEARDLIPLYEKKYASCSNKERREKIKLSLLRRGFSEKDIDSALSELSPIPNSLETKNAICEAGVFYRRYQRKYNGKELYYHLEMALLRKGYDKRAIQKALEEIKDGSH